MSQTRRRYNKPSVVEAIFEAVFDFTDYDASLIGEFYAEVKKKFPQKKDLNFFSFHIETQGQNPKPPSIPTFQAWADNNSSLLQFGPGIFTANCLKYKSWENFIEEIEFALDAFTKVSQPKKLLKTGTRYINRWVLPNDCKFQELFDFNLSVPQALTQLNGFELSMQIKTSEISNTDMDSVVRFRTDSLLQNETGLAIVLDIDCFKNDAKDADKDLIIEYAKSSHTIISSIFESSIKDELRKMMGVY